MVESLRTFLKAFDQVRKCLQSPVQKHEVEIGTKNQPTLSLLFIVEVSLNIQLDKLVYLSDLGNIFCVFSIKILNYTVINNYIQNLSTLTNAKFTASTRTNITLQTSVERLRAFTTCSTFTPDCRYDNSNSEHFGNVYCSSTVCSRLLFVHEKLFSNSEEAKVNVFNARQPVRCPIFLLKNKQIRFTRNVIKRFIILNRLNNQVKIAILYCPGKHSSKEKCVNVHTWKKNDESCYECL